MGCAASTPATVPFVTSKADGTKKPIKLSDSGQLDLSELDLTEIPDAISPLARDVRDLSLEKNTIDVSAPSFGQMLKSLVVLRRLNLEGNRLTAVPEAIFQLPKLEQLLLRNNALKEVPAAVRHLGRSLVELSLDRNFLSVLPEELGELRSLRLLSAGHNVITGLPDTVSGMQALNTLWLEHNRVRVLCDGLCALENLEDLNLHDNRLTALPANVQQLRSLKWLSLGKNRFTELPAALFVMPALETLHAQNNMLKALPPVPTFTPSSSDPVLVNASSRGGTDPLGRAIDDPLGRAIDCLGSAKDAPASDDSTESGTEPSSTPLPASRGEGRSGLRVVWLSGNPLCSDSMPPASLMQLPGLEECRMKIDHHGRPMRSSSFDLENWKAAVDVATQIEAVNANRQRRGSFKQDHGIDSNSPAPIRRKVSFSGQLPGQLPNATSPNGPSPAGSRSPANTRAV